MGFLPCLLCGNKLEKRLSKRSKPYFHCDGCGVQLFVRRKEGIERLEKLLQASEQNALYFEQSAHRVFQVQALLSEIDSTKAQIRKVEGEIGIIFQDEDKIRARNSLKIRLDNLLDSIRRIRAQRSALKICEAYFRAQSQTDKKICKRNLNS